MKRNRVQIAQRQVDAEVRQEASDKRSPKERIARLDQFGHTATKERARLGKRIDNHK